MRMSMAVVMGLAAGLALCGVAQAQDASSDQLIQSLKPKTLGLTKGLKAPKPAPAPAQSSTSVSSAPLVAARQQQAAADAGTISAPSASLTVEFRSGSADLTPRAMHTLDQLGRALTSSTLASYKFRIEGHTDTVGTKDANQALSDKRAQAVVAYLESRFNVSADRLQGIGMGEDGLAVQTGDQVAEPRNRRVQVVNLGA